MQVTKGMTFDFQDIVNVTIYNFCGLVKCKDANKRWYLIFIKSLIYCFLDENYLLLSFDFWRFERIIFFGQAQ